MDQNPPVMAKKVFKLIRLMFFMLKKGITKSRFFTDLNLIMKRGKIAGKSLHKILFHHHQNHPSATVHHHPHHLSFPTPPPSDDEFSCTTTPQHPSSILTTGDKNSSHAPTHAPPYADVVKKLQTHAPMHAPSYAGGGLDEIMADPGVFMALEMLSSASTHAPPYANSAKKLQTHAPMHAPSYDGGGSDEIMADPGVMMAVEMLTSGGSGGASPGTSPVGRLLRITDSPFPLSNGDEDGQVDEAAEKFILKFYDGLKRES